MSGIENKKIRTLATSWAFNADLMTCKECGYSTIASRINEPAGHADYCGNATTPNPWYVLAQILARMSPKHFNLLWHLQHQRTWSMDTFGPGERTVGVVDHIRKELDEILAKPDDVSEWIDVVILALDGAWRIGATPEQIIAALVAKQAKNENRQWPDWRTAEPDKAIEHVRADYPAEYTVHCPNGPEDVCNKHAHTLKGLMSFMGVHAAVTAAPEGAQCANCVNEAKKEEGVA